MGKHISQMWKRLSSVTKEREDLKDEQRKLMEEVDKRLNTVLEQQQPAKQYEGTPFVEDALKIFEERQNKPSAQSISRDPFKNYGFGIVAYFELLRTLICAYLLMTVFAVVIMVIFTNGDALENNGDSFLTQFSLGNLGFSRFICTTQFPTLPKDIDLSCRSGEFTDLKYYGIIPDKHGMFTKDGT